MATAYRFRSRTDEALKEMDAPRTGVWVDVENITSDEIAQLVDQYKLEEGHLKDAQDFFEAPRVEKEDGAVYFYTRYPAHIQGEMTTAPMLIVLGDDYVLTILHNRPQWFEKLLKRKDLFTTQKSKLFLQILDAVEKEYTRVFTTMRRDVRRARLSVSDVSEKAIEDSVNLEYAINEFVSALLPTNAALQQVLSQRMMSFYDDDIDLIEDVQHANAQLIESAKNALKTIQNIRAAHATLVSSRLNRVVRRLTALTILLTLPTIIGTIYGMNIALPFQESPAAFPVILVLILLVVAAVSYLFVRNKWF